MKKILSFIAAVIVATFALSSCSVLTQKQLKMVKELTIRADSVASAPVIVFETLVQVRVERGLMYAASLSTAAAHSEEVKALAKAAVEDRKIVEKSDVYIDVINSYLRVLRSVANNERYEAVGREVRSLGRRLDTLMIFYNSFEPEKPMKKGVANTAGKAFAGISEQILKGCRAKLMKELVLEADTIVATCVDSLIDVLKSNQMNQLITNESVGLQDNYTAYLMAMEARGLMPDTEVDRRYVELYAKMSQVASVRNRCVSALRSFKKAHGRLAASIASDGEDDVEGVYAQIVEFNDQAADMCRQIKEIFE